MPTLNVKTVSSEQVWKSPDGQRTIYKVVLDYNGQQMTAKTFSGAIAAQGWSGEVLTEERPGRNGSETFVKQPPKEGGSFSGGYSPATKAAGPAQAPKREFDNFTMYLSYAKDLVVALQNTEGYNQESFEKLL